MDGAAEAAGGALGGGSTGFSLGGPVGAGVGALVGGAIGLFTAKKRAAEAKRQALYNNGLAGNDTIYGSFKGGLNAGHTSKAEEETPSALGSALQGGLAGAQQGINIYDGLRGKPAAKAAPAAAGLTAEEALGNIQAGAPGQMLPARNDYSNILKYMG